MAGKTFANEINEVEVSLAIQRLLISDFPQAWTPARVDIATPPSGFVDLGAVVEDSPSFTVSREKFELDAGLPKVRQYEAVIGLQGSFEISLHSNSWRKVQYAFGNVSAISSTTVCGTIASVTDRNTITFASTSDCESLTLGVQFVIAATAAGFDKADAVETRVASITTDGLTYFLDPTPIRTPVANDLAGIYPFVQQYVGTSQIRRHVLLAVADFIDGSQVCHHFFKAVPGSEFNEDIRPTENERIPLSFVAFGVSTTDVPGLSQSELVIARRVYFPPTSPV